MPAYKTSSAKLANGEIVFRDDHVYVSPPWSERDGTPYWVARIIDFLPPNSTPKKGAARRTASAEVSVKLSLYYRPGDISGRNVSDFRVLLATIHTDVQPLSNVRGKCYVRHRDRIEDLLKWKKSPDHFYFMRFYDPYIKREFEVIPTENIKNIPPHVRDTLMLRYSFLVTEREMVADLTDAFRNCCICDLWASSQESVRCEVCKNNYHMNCLNPPLLAKPAKGYSWVCLPCSLQRRKDVEEQKFHFGTTNGASARPTKNAVKVKDATPIPARQELITYRGWPWRYFGQYTRAEDTLDPDDPIFPRAATRVGMKYQAVVPSWEEQQEAEARHRLGEAEAGPSRHIGVERGLDIGERKHESTLEVWCTPSDELNSYMAEASSLDLPVPPWDVTRLNMELQAFTTLGRLRALGKMQSLRLSDFSPIHFTDKETAVFEAELEKNGGLEAHETAKVLGKRPAEVLRFSYIWKNKKLKAENEALRQHHRVNTSHARQNKTLGAPSLRIRGRAGSEASDDEVSLHGGDYPKTNPKVQCAACSTRISNVWWKCPRTVHGDAMCESCGSNYRKYGVISFVKAEDTKKPDKKDPLAKRKEAGSGASTPVPPPPPKLPPCACCRRMEPKPAMARCKTCTFAAHAGCYGIAPQDMGPEWECELCLNARLEEYHLHPRCVLCPRETSSLSTVKKSKKSPSDFDLLSAYKPTEGRRWAHILCSMWMPGVLYTDPVTMKAVEGVTSISRRQWEETCSLCKQDDGATINCAECGISFHAACAWQSGHRFGFEFSLAKPGKKEIVTIAKFKEGEGVMTASVWCRGHDLEGRTIYEMHELDPEQNETALQIFTAAYKALPPHDESFAILRKARRLDALIPALEPAEEHVECYHCGIDVSPLWHWREMGVDRGGDGDGDVVMDVVKRRLCHLCDFKLP